VDSKAEVVIPQELTETAKKRVDKPKSSVIMDCMNETKIAESEIAKSIEDYLDGCSKQELIDLHNFIFSEYISDLDDVEWGE
jgi:hypothetical protein